MHRDANGGRSAGQHNRRCRVRLVNPDLQLGRSVQLERIIHRRHQQQWSSKSMRATGCQQDYSSDSHFVIRDDDNRGRIGCRLCNSQRRVQSKWHSHIRVPFRVDMHWDRDFNRSFRKRNERSGSELRISVIQLGWLVWLECRLLGRLEQQRSYEPLRANDRG